MEFDRLDFVATIEMLASRAGLEVPRDNNAESTEKQQKRKSIYSILDQSLAFYGEQLRHHQTRSTAVDYLKQRGLTGEVARDFGLGYAPPGWDNLYASLAKTNLEHDLLIESGMVVEKNDQPNQKDKVYDRFRERVMFPIRDLRGRVIAFGGRIIGDGKPKYLNSPETPVFHKGRELYGLYEARRRNKKLTQLLVVEGYMDVVALAQNGINYSVATLGTATTGEHLERLYRMVSTVVFCFDGDAAGRNAAWKALLIALSHMKDGRSARFLFIPDGEDPDSLVRKEGKEKFEWRLDQAQHLPDFFFDKLTAEISIESLDGKAQLSNQVMPMIMKIPAGVFRELMIGRLSEITGLSTEKLLIHAGADRDTSLRPSHRDELVDTSLSPPPDDWDEHSLSEYEEQYEDYYPDQPDQEPSELARKAISLLLTQPDLASKFTETDYNFLESSAGSGLLLEIIRTIFAEEIESSVILIAKYQGRPEFTQLKYLAEEEQLLALSDLPVEYCDVIRVMRDRHQEENDRALERRLLAKPFSELSDADKRKLRELSRAKKR